jgi:hypothetical protein
MEKINWTDRAKNEVLHRVEEERNILLTGLFTSWVGTAFWNMFLNERRKDLSEGKTRNKT